MADYLEGTYLTGILHMGTDAGACIIIPYPHDTEGIGGIRRKFAQVNNVSRLFTIHELDGDIVVLGTSPWYAMLHRTLKSITLSPGKCSLSWDSVIT